MKTIWVKWRDSGFHYWPGVRDHREDQLYLSVRHRHVFHFLAMVNVEGDDREVEFHDLLAHCRAYTEERRDGESWGGASCEAIASQLIDHIEAKWPGRQPRVTVSEDGECGATIDRD
jgi:hypothetical protein